MKKLGLGVGVHGAGENGYYYNDMTCMSSGQILNAMFVLMSCRFSQGAGTLSKAMVLKRALSLK